MDTEAARAIVDANSYMTLATADADGAPWASPVWFAHEQYETFLWMSHFGARQLPARSRALSSAEQRRWRVFI